MELNQIRNIYMLGIGGIGMSGMARYFHHRGAHVSGYDLSRTPLTDKLQEEGICVFYNINPDRICKNIDLLIYTPAIPADNPELAKARKKGILLKKRSEVLGMITKGKFTIAVAGTHGKTTISSMIAHLLKSSGKKISAFIGGISKNYESNYIDDQEAEMVIVEADEFDRSFLQLNPDIAVVTSMDPDHLDIYQTPENLKATFFQFIKCINPNGSLIIHNELELPGYLPADCITYGLSQNAGFHAEAIRSQGSISIFNIKGPDTNIENIHLKLPGNHNIENAVAAVTVAVKTGINQPEIGKGLNTYTGVKRRFDIRLHTKDHIYIDDYAHHPCEISSCINAVKKLFPEKPVTVVFQPHLYTRTRDFADGFAKSLALADKVYLLDIYPAREVPIEGISSKWLFEKIRLKNKELCSKNEVIEKIEKNKPELLLTLGAGDIDRLVEALENTLKDK